MTSRRPFWLWGAAVLACLSGMLAGPTIYAVATMVWSAFQPRFFVSGWDVVAVLALLSLVWLMAIYAIARRLHGKVAVAFAVATFAVASGTVLYEQLQPPTRVTHFKLTGEQAAAWRDYRP